MQPWKIPGRRVVAGGGPPAGESVEELEVIRGGGALVGARGCADWDVPDACGWDAGGIGLPVVEV